VVVTLLIDDNERLKTSFIHIWVWAAMIFTYFYVAFVYFYTDAVQQDISEGSQMWIPVDMLLTALLFISHVSLLGYEKYKAKKKNENENHGSYEYTHNLKKCTIPGCNCHAEVAIRKVTSPQILS